MKTPYRLMDRKQHRRQMNRQAMRHLSYIQSPSKEKLKIDGSQKFSDPLNDFTLKPSLSKNFDKDSSRNKKAQQTSDAFAKSVLKQKSKS